VNLTARANGVPASEASVLRLPVMAADSKHPLGPPMTPGNMRELGCAIRTAIPTTTILPDGYLNALPV
jgi:hypothetical protein